MKTSTRADPVFRLCGVTRQWQSHGVRFLLDIPQLDILPGERVALVGVSGSGKSTLLDLLAMALKPTRCDQFTFTNHACVMFDVAGAWLHGDQDALTRARRESMGYVLQSGGLLGFLSVRGNIELSRRICGQEDDGQVEMLAQRLGIEDQLAKFPAELSVGQRQRVAIARALAHDPQVIIADEPTAALDPVNAASLMQLFIELAQESGVTTVIASHDWARVEGLGFRILRNELRRDGEHVRSILAA